jgi:hypothetical protein
VLVLICLIASDTVCPPIVFSLFATESPKKQVERFVFRVTLLLFLC